MKAAKNVNFKTIKEFVSHHLLANQHVRTDDYPALNIIDKTQRHEPRVTPSEKVDEWLPWAHIAIGNLKTLLLGTFHGVTGNYLQEYLNEFCYRYNRRFVEKQIPNRLLNMAIIHAPLKLTSVKWRSIYYFKGSSLRKYTIGSDFKAVTLLIKITT